MNYFFLVVSFLVVSVTTFLVVSFLVVSAGAAALAMLSALAAESADEVVALPLQAAAETAIARAKKPILNAFFLFQSMIFCFYIDITN